MKHSLNPRCASGSDGCTWLVWTIVALLVLVLGGLSGMGCGRKSGPTDDFLRLSNLGKSHLDRGDGAKALESFQQALRLQPTNPDAQLNVANALLLANRPDEAIAAAKKVLEMDSNSAAAHYVIGCANLRLNKNEEALKALQESQRIDPAVTAVNFQLGLAQERLGRLDEAIAQWQTAIEFDPDHPAAHYRLSQVLQRAGRTDEASEQLKLHQAILAKRGNAATDVSAFERCKHTMARLPFQPEEPLPDGIRVTFADATGTAMPSAAAGHAPICVIDVNHDGRNSLFVGEGEGFRLWVNNGGGRFEPAASLLPGTPGADYRRSLVGDLQNDRYEDVVVLGEKASHVFKLATNFVVTDITRFSGLKDLTGTDGVLIDFDYTGKLGLITVQPGGAGMKVYRNLGNSYFTQTGVTSGLPATAESVGRVVVDDWNGDELLDIAFTRSNSPPLVFARQRGGAFAPTNTPAIPVATAMASADLNNDLPARLDRGNSLRPSSALQWRVQHNAGHSVGRGPGDYSDRLRQRWMARFARGGRCAAALAESSARPDSKRPPRRRPSGQPPVEKWKPLKQRISMAIATRIWSWPWRAAD
jgi:tetratricopeptide (TPR) repeat protein